MHNKLLRIVSILVLTVLAAPVFAQDDAEVVALKKSLTTEKTDTGKILILSDLAFYYANRDAKVAMEYVTQELAIADHVTMPKFKAIAINDKAIALYYNGQYTEALTYNKQALEIRKKIGDEKQIISSLNKIAVIYQELGDYKVAADYQFEVLRMAERLKNPGYISLTYNNLAYLFQMLHQYDKSIAYARQSLAIVAATDDSASIAKIFGNLATSYEHKGVFDSAVYYDRLAVAYFRQLNALFELSAAYNDLGLVFRGKDMNDSGLFYYKKAYGIAVQLGNESDQAFYAANAGQTLVDMKRLGEAYPYLDSARRINQKENKIQIWKTLYSALNEYYIYKGVPDSALAYRELYTVMVDSIFSESALHQVNELQAKYETEKKEQQIALLNKQTIIQKLVIGKRNITIAIIIIILIAAVISGVLFYNRYRLRQEAKLQAEIINQQDMATKGIIEAEEHERQRIAGDLHDGVGQMFSVVKMNLSGLVDRIEVKDEKDQQLLDKTLNLVDESCKEVRVIAHQMMPNILLKSGLASAIRDFIDKIDAERLKINLETFGLQERLESNVETVLYRVIQESVNNVIKHASATALDIQLHKDEEGINVTIEDNGVGFDTTRREHFEGIGLKNIITRVGYLKGKVEFDSAPGKGTVVVIFIPYNV